MYFFWLSNIFYVFCVISGILSDRGYGFLRYVVEIWGRADGKWYRDWFFLGIFGVV